jgi:PIN domain nuclease of toxin-antitoxin system
MNLLLDTHALLWSLINDPKLSQEAHAEIVDPDNRVFVSTISIAEIRIKESIGKLEDVPSDLYSLLLRVPFEILNFNLEHAIALGSLPHHHRDPFDWMLIVQAQVEDLILVTRDRKIEQYAVQTLKA